MNADQLGRWASATPAPFPAWQRVAAFVLSIVGALALLWVFGTGFMDPGARRALIITGLIEMGLFFMIRDRVLATVAAVNEPARDLDILRICSQLWRRGVSLRRGSQLFGPRSMSKAGRLARLLVCVA